MPTHYRNIFHCLLIGLLIILCYSNSLKVPFHFDDYPNIVKKTNVHLDKLTWENIKKTSNFSGVKEHKISRPIARLTFALNYYFFGLNTLSFHLVNIAVHCITACFLYLLFCQILINIPTIRSQNTFSPDAFDTALLATILWAIHPIQVQAVTYIVQRMASMAAMFYIIAFYCYCRFRFDRQTIWRIIFVILAFSSWLLGVFSKENAVLLPLAILCFEFVFFPLTRKRKLFAIFLCFLFISVTVSAFLILRGNIIEYLETLYTSRPFSMWERLLTEPRIIIQYLKLLLLPVNTSLTHESDILLSTSLFSPITTILSIILLILLSFFSLLLVRTRYKLISFAILFFFINHLVESTFIGLELYFEHRNYLPSMFLFLALASLILQGKAYYARHQRLFMHGLVTVSIIFLIIGEGSTTWLRNEDWRSKRSLLEDAIMKAPENIRPRISLAVDYMNTEEYDKAKKELVQAENLVKKFPNRYQQNHIGLLYYNAGGLHYKLGNNDKALLLYDKSIRLYPGHSNAHANLGYLCFKKGKIDCAEQSYANALQIKKENPKLYNMLARVYYKKGEFGKAKAILEAGIRIGDLPILSLNLIGVTLAQNDTQKAKRIFHQLPTDQNDLIYLLYKAILQTETQQEKTAKQIGRHLFSHKISLCEWIQKVKENNSAGVIYPDIQHIESYIREGYNSAFNINIQDLQKHKESESNCTDQEEQEEQESIPSLLFNDSHPLVNLGNKVKNNHVS